MFTVLVVIFHATLQTDILNNANALALIAIIVTIVFGFFTIVATIWAVVYSIRKQRELQREQQREQQVRKEVTYEVISDAPIMSVDRSVANKVQVLLGGQPPIDIRQVVIEVSNTGNISIKSKDYLDDKLTFEFGEFGDEVIGGEVIATYPDRLIDYNRLPTFLTVNPR
jgi:predicted histidine transporter YuiF (NhaC family)